MSQTLNIVHRKPKTNQVETPNEAQGRDLFQTPNYATELLIPFIPNNILRVWECAAGYGKIANVLLKNHFYVSQSDIRLVGAISKVHNFLSDGLGEHQLSWIEQEKPFAIITNPPFSLKRKFYEKCLEYKVPFALLIPADYSGWIIKAIQDGAEKIIPTRRIDFITPTGLSGATGHTSYYHSMWLTWGFNLGKTETFVELTKEMKNNI